MALTTSEGAAEMTRAVKVVWGGVQKLSPLSLSALTPIGILRIQKMARRDFPPIPSLLLPPNNILTNMANNPDFLKNTAIWDNLAEHQEAYDWVQHKLDEQYRQGRSTTTSSTQ
jgi:hypothetical protein